MLRKEKLREMATAANGNSKNNLPHLECVDRFNQLPVVETAFEAVGKFYHKLKRSYTVAEWTLGAAEASVVRLAHTLAPPLSKPLHMADSALCHSLDFVEGSLPAVKLPPQQLLENMQSMVREGAGALARPVLHRASSVRELAARRVNVAREYGVQRANSVLSTRVGSLAADGLDVGLELAEHLMDTFLPADNADEAEKQNGDVDAEDEDEVDSGTEQTQQQVRHRTPCTEQNRALHTVHRVDRLTRTLQRRLTRHTLAQVKSVREHAMDAVAYMLGLARVAVTDPVGAARNVAAVWTELSGDEPENQPPPETVEQRLALLAREAARRVVHLTNAIAVLPSAAAATFSQLLIEVLHGARLDGPVHAVLGFSRRRYEQLELLVKQLDSLTSQIATLILSPWKREVELTETNNVLVPANHINTSQS